MAQIPKDIELKLKDVDVLTAGMAAQFVNSILDFLLFQRSQIPFVYKTYKYYVEKWDENDLIDNENESFKNYQLQKQRSLAKETKEAISNMRQLIRSAFQSSNAVKSLRFLFGNNTFMPSESYTIHIPHASISKHHGNIHCIPNGPMNQTLLQLLTYEDLYSLWSTELQTTNVFLELELLTNGNEQELEVLKLFPKDVISQLPRSCKNIHLHLLHDSEKENDELQCCKEMTIYEDNAILNIHSSDEEKEVCNKDAGLTTSWWQTDLIVRGFRASSLDLWSS